MRALDYALRQAWASLLRSRVASSFAVMAIALAVVVLGALLLLTWNTQRLVDQWSATAFSCGVVMSTVRPFRIRH